MTAHEQHIVERMDFLGEKGNILLEKYPHVKRKTQRQAIRLLSRMAMEEKQEKEFLEHFEEQYPVKEGKDEGRLGKNDDDTWQEERETMQNPDRSEHRSESEEL